jgi:hypothetical protein
MGFAQPNQDKTFTVHRSPFAVRRSAARRHYGKACLPDLTKALNGSSLPPEAVTLEKGIEMIAPRPFELRQRTANGER